MQLKTKIQVYLELSISVSVWLSIWSFWIQGHTIIGISIEGSFEKAAIQMLIVPIYWAKKNRWEICSTHRVESCLEGNKTWKSTDQVKGKVVNILFLCLLSYNNTYK